MRKFKTTDTSSTPTEMSFPKAPGCFAITVHTKSIRLYTRAHTASDTYILIYISFHYSHLTLSQTDNLNFSASNKINMVGCLVFTAEHIVCTDSDMECSRHFFVQYGITAQIRNIGVHSKS